MIPKTEEEIHEAIGVFTEDFAVVNAMVPPDFNAAIRGIQAVACVAVLSWVLGETEEEAKEHLNEGMRWVHRENPSILEAYFSVPPSEKTPE